MKVFLEVPSVHILNFLTERLAQAEDSLKKDEAMLLAVTESKIIRPGQDLTVKHNIEMRTGFIKTIKREIEMVKTHSDESVSVELEV